MIVMENSLKDPLSDEFTTCSLLLRIVPISVVRIAHITLNILFVNDILATDQFVLYSTAAIIVAVEIVAYVTLRYGFLEEGSGEPVKIAPTLAWHTITALNISCFMAFFFSPQIHMFEYRLQVRGVTYILDFFCLLSVAIFIHMPVCSDWSLLLKYGMIQNFLWLPYCLTSVFSCAMDYIFYGEQWSLYFVCIFTAGISGYLLWVWVQQVDLWGKIKELASSE